MNGKLYIGQTGEDNLYRRFGKNGEYYHNSSYFYNAIQKYNWNNFEHIILIDNLTLEEANIIEEELIKKYKSNDVRYGYNLKTGGQNSKHSERTKRKMSNVKIGKYKGMLNGRSKSVSQYDPKTKKLVNTYQSIQEASSKYSSSSGISACCNGLMGQAYGYIWCFSDDEPNFNYKDKRRNRAKKVIQMDKDKNIIEIYKSTMEAERFTNIDRGSISKCCNGKQCTAGGYIWKYKKEVS